MSRAMSAGRWPPSVSVSIAMAIGTGYVPAGEREQVRRCIRPCAVGADSAAWSRPHARTAMTLTAIERRRATLVSADAAGYSRLMAVDELATIQAIKVFREAAEQIADEHGGRLVDSPGDNLLFEYGNAASALDASLRFEKFVLDTNEQYEPANRMQFRMGVHCGEVIVDTDRIYGSRDQHRSAARAAGTTRRHLHLGAQLGRSRATPRRWRTSARSTSRTSRIRSTPSSSTSPGRRGARQADDVVTGPPIAVCRTAAPGNAVADYLADGLVDDLITNLAMWHQFPVIARNSTFTCKNRKNIDPAARRQGARRRVPRGRQPATGVDPAGADLRAQLLEAEPGRT